jgi:exonuclease SbcD
MKILHTADWHIGKHLHNIDLYFDFQHFSNFLLDFIKEENIDLVLVAGDIFESSVPTNQARKQYFDILTSLVRLGVKVVITAGNHDSISNIEAPKEILEYLDIYVVGDLNSMQPILLQDVVILPIPFLYDKDVRKIVAEQSELDRVEAVKKGIVYLYEQQSLMIKNQYPDKVSIAMGHLFLQGVAESESERDIQVGKQAGVEAKSFENLFDYIALGHIHRPQQLADNIRYSGSPIPLSFSERKDTKGFVALTIEGKTLKHSFVEVPKWRNFIRVTGTFETIKVKLQDLIDNTYILPSLIDVEVIEELEDPSLRLQINDWLTRFNSDQCIIANYKIKFLNSDLALKKLLTTQVGIEEMQPRNVFLQRIEEEVQNSEDIALFIEAFDELVDNIIASDKTTFI